MNYVSLDEIEQLEVGLYNSMLCGDFGLVGGSNQTLRENVIGYQFSESRDPEDDEEEDDDFDDDFDDGFDDDDFDEESFEEEDLDWDEEEDDDYSEIDDF
ncbi:MAG: hypothetical protein WDZ35_01065 [Crocinitomicaceae bacterium]